MGMVRWEPIPSRQTTIYKDKLKQIIERFPNLNSCTKLSIIDNNRFKN
jgi:hypothetical protein